MTSPAPRLRDIFLPAHDPCPFPSCKEASSPRQSLHYPHKPAAHCNGGAATSPLPQLALTTDELQSPVAKSGDDILGAPLIGSLVTRSSGIGCLPLEGGNGLGKEGGKLLPR